jgi:hypothetical protein
MKPRLLAKPNRRPIKEWRSETAAEAASAIKTFRSGKLKSASADKIIGRLQKVTS